MFLSYTNIKYVFIYLLTLLIFSTLSLLIDNALASVVDGSINNIENEEKVHLRGEVWYGNASWYGRRFHGRKTSNGEKYNKRDLTAAHKYLPFNTRVLVTNLKNNKSVIVRINDRGPFVDNRIIDLSEGAAKKIDLKKQGIAYIKLRVIN